jgi:serine/threonine-protein phosphatase 2B catalytic subunit
MQSQDFVFDRLPDPLGDRVVKEVPLPPHRPLGTTQVYPQYLQYGNIAKPNYKIVRECLILDGKLEKKVVLKLIQDTIKVTKKETNVVPREGEVAIIGDIHGQFFDMVAMLDEFTPRLEKQEPGFGLVFLGDYVDRGI